jgi:hypothetical protein
VIRGPKIVRPPIGTVYYHGSTAQPGEATPPAYCAFLAPLVVLATGHIMEVGAPRNIGVARSYFRAVLEKTPILVDVESTESRRLVWNLTRDYLPNKDQFFLPDYASALCNMRAFPTGVSASCSSTHRSSCASGPPGVRHPTRFGAGRPFWASESRLLGADGVWYSPYTYTYAVWRPSLLLAGATGETLDMKRRKKSSPEPHCKNVTRENGKRRKMCWDAKGKITSAAKVEAYRKRKRTRRAA